MYARQTLHVIEAVKASILKQAMTIFSPTMAKALVDSLTAEAWVQS
jgi:hypothetical protein